MITVFLIDDDPATRALLRLRLELDGDIAVIGEAWPGPDAPCDVAALAPDVVLLGTRLPIGDHESAVALVGAFVPRSTVIMLSLYDDPLTRAHLLAAGAFAVVSKHEADDLLFEVIRSARA
jgi:DNA-binding NarL/FixJ family response regulator